MHTILLFLILTHHLLFCKLNKKPFAIKILSLFFACCSLLICSVFFFGELLRRCVRGRGCYAADLSLCCSKQKTRRNDRAPTF